MGELYDLDVVEWSDLQARLLRQHAAGERPNEAPDWPHIIEEIEAVGQSQVDAIGSLLFQAFLHDLKADAWPDARDAPAWRGEARGFRAQARRRYRPSMRQKPDLSGIYADALSAMPESLDGQPAQAVAPSCQVRLDDLMSAESPR